MLDMQAICFYAVVCAPGITACVPLTVEVVLMRPGLDGLDSDPERPHLAREINILNLGKAEKAVQQC